MPVMMGAPAFTQTPTPSSPCVQIVVNGVAIGKDFENLDRYVCIAAAQNRTTDGDPTW